MPCPGTAPWVPKLLYILYLLCAENHNFIRRQVTGRLLAFFQGVARMPHGVPCLPTKTPYTSQVPSAPPMHLQMLQLQPLNSMLACLLAGPPLSLSLFVFPTVLHAGFHTLYVRKRCRALRCGCSFILCCAVRVLDFRPAARAATAPHSLSACTQARDASIEKPWNRYCHPNTTNKGHQFWQSYGAKKCLSPVFWLVPESTRKLKKKKY